MDEYRKAQIKRWKEANPDKVKAYGLKWREKNRERLNNSTKEWQKNNPEKAEQIRQKWNADNPDKSREMRERAQKRKRQKYPEKVRARQAAYYAEQLGLLVNPGACENCHQDRVLHKHHDDYTKPLDIRWLCTRCHSDYHHSQRGMVNHEST